MTEYPSKEYELIRRIRTLLPPAGPRSPYEMTIGDDAAIRINSVAGERLVVTADVAVENVHFSLQTMTFEEIGYRSMASNLSDCAAMGAKPDGAVVQIVFPKDSGINNSNINTGVNNVGIDTAIERIYAGFAKACGRWNFPIIGGDLSGGSVWTIGITLIGAAPPAGRLLMRAGIADGDALWVTGAPGESAAGLAAIGRWGRGSVPQPYKRFVDAHVTPVPAVDEGMALAACPAVRAMMDLSDGLSKDIATLCFDNHLGFIFDQGVSQRAPSAMTDLANDLGADCIDWFYHGGEEYELLFACDPSFDPRAINAIAKNKPNMTRLGHFTSTTRKVLIHSGGINGKTEELPVRGWDHFNY